jgi:carboxypeptidase PM20D1
MSRFAVEIERRPFPARLSKAAAEMFDTLGRRSSFLYRMIFANLWLFRPLLDMICRKSGGELNALMRTTCALTMSEGSSAPNVLPPKVRMVANLRIISGESMESAQDYLKVLAERVIDKKLELQIRRIDGSDPCSVSNTDSDGWRRLVSAIRDTWPEAVVSPYLMIAASDARHYHRICDRVFRFSVLELSKEERGLIHGNNERIPVEKIGKCVQFYRQLICSC